MWGDRRRDRFESASQSGRRESRRHADGQDLVEQEKTRWRRVWRAETEIGKREQAAEARAGKEGEAPA